MLTAKYVAAPRSIYRQIDKVEPGTLIQVAFNGKAVRRRYWQISDYFKGPSIRPSGERGQTNWLDHVKDAVENAVSRQMVADVPVGVFLSSGTDSSLVAAVASRLQPSVQSFTVGFPVTKYNEAGQARQIARHLGTDHHEFLATPCQVMETLLKLPEYYDEPFGDASAVPTFLISQFARTTVKVILSGDGGDEQFFGYPRYRIIASLYPFLKHRPAWLGRLAATRCGRVPRGNACRLVSGLVAFPDEASLYTHYVLENFSRLTELVGGGEAATLWKSGLFRNNLKGHQFARSAGGPYGDGLMLADLINYLPDDCLTKVDRASMANSLEVRVPLLDENVIKTSLNLPIQYKWRGLHGKAVLKQALRRYLPDDLIYRPKKGFGVPLDRWLFHELKEFTMDLLSRDNLLRADLDPKGVHKIIDHHTKGCFRSPVLHLAGLLLCRLAQGAKVNSLWVNNACRVPEKSWGALHWAGLCIFCWGVCLSICLARIRCALHL